jgi:RecB family exonuclease
MKTIKLAFSEDPSRYTARYLEQSGYSSERTLIVSPTERFKSYFAHHLLGISGCDSLPGPGLVTSAHLVSTLSAFTGKQRAGEAEKLSMLFAACEETEGIEELFGKKILHRFDVFRRTALDIFRAFDELNAEMLDIEHLPERGEVSAYREFARHFRIFQDLFRRYRETQVSRGVIAQSFLLGQIHEDVLKRFFSPYDHVILVSPLSLTVFEKYVYEVINQKLDVIYQDTDQYDFSKILGFGSGEDLEKKTRNPVLSFFELPTRTEQLMALLGELEKDLESGVDPCEISVVNTDSLFCEMLYDTLVRAGIPVNYSEGLQVKKSPIFGFLALVDSFYAGDRDTRLFVEIARNEVFREAFCDLSPREIKNLEKTIIKERVFTLTGKHAYLAKHNPRLHEGFSRLEKMYRAVGFQELSEVLSDFFSRFRGKKTYDFYAVRDIVLNEVCKLSSFTPKFLERPFQILREILSHNRYTMPGIYREGVQIIGLLETRGITFKRVYVPSFNEGFFPLRREKDMLLNANVRGLLGLSTLVDREDLQFYYLKRIVDSSDRAIFFSIDDRTGEIDVKSRYMYHFEDFYDVEKEDPVYTLPFETGDSIERRSEGSPESQQGQQQRFSEKTAPSFAPAVLHSPVLQLSRLDLDTMKRCETKYFISKVLGIAEEEELSREIELNEVGRKVHELFFHLYRTPVYRTPGDERHYREKFENLFHDIFEESMFYSREEALLKRILHENLRNVLENDIERFSQGCRVCAEYAETELSAQIGRNASTYTLRGRIDRVDQLPSGGYEIIDYKTGNLPRRGDHFEKKGFKEVQLGFYGLMFRNACAEAELVQMSYYDLTGKNRTEVVVEPSQIGEYLDAFEMHIMDFLDGVNGSRALELAHELEECAYCPYFNICRVFEL